MSEMIDLGVTIDFSEVEDKPMYSLWRAGVYDVTVQKGSVSEKNGNRMLTLEYQNKDGDVILGRYNYEHSNTTAQNIARADLKKIILATGLVSADEIDRAKMSQIGGIVGKRLTIRVAQTMGKPYTDRNGNEKPAQMQNEIKGYFKLGSATAVAESDAEAQPVKHEAAPTQVKRNPFAA